MTKYTTKSYGGILVGEVVICDVCARHKKPFGRDSMDNGLCDRDCVGYDVEPYPQYLWPGERIDDSFGDAFDRVKLSKDFNELIQLCSDAVCDISQIVLIKEWLENNAIKRNV